MGELSPSVLHDAGLPSALKWLGENMRRYGLRVEVNVEDLSFEIPEDEAVLLFQSARELLWNVVKHAATDRAVLSLDTSSAGYLSMTIQDQGKGFDPTPTEPPSAGRHFGLFSVRERIQAMGGEVTLYSSPGKGTCITLKAPIPKTSQEQAMPTRQALPAPRLAQSRLARPLRILLVDDHVMVRQGLHGILASYPDFSVIGEASNGEEAVRNSQRDIA
jgi:signal transduction histidine kinase